LIFGPHWARHDPVVHDLWVPPGGNRSSCYRVNTFLLYRRTGIATRSRAESCGDTAYARAFNDREQTTRAPAPTTSSRRCFLQLPTRRPPRIKRLGRIPTESSALRPPPCPNDNGVLSEPHFPEPMGKKDRFNSSRLRRLAGKPTGAFDAVRQAKHTDGAGLRPDMRRYASTMCTTRVIAFLAGHLWEFVPAARPDKSGALL
jgi:hypothetical protein